MGCRIVKKILGKDKSKDRTEYGEGWDKIEWKESPYGGKPILTRTRLKKKTPQSVIDDINKRFK